MFQTCKKFKKLIRQDIPAFIVRYLPFPFVKKHPVYPNISPRKAAWHEIAFDMLDKPMALSVGGFIVTMAGMVFNKSVLFSFLATGLWLSLVLWMKQGNFTARKHVTFSVLLGIAIIIVTPFLQQFIQPPDLDAESPRNRKDAKDIMIRIKNSGETDLPQKSSQIRFGILDIYSRKMDWIKAKRATKIRTDKSVAFAFKRPESIQKNAYGILVVINDKLRWRYYLEVFYTGNSGENWYSFSDEIGFVDLDESFNIDEYIENLEKKIKSNYFDKKYNECFV